MTSIREFTMNDLLKFNNINLDVLTETYNMPFYMSYMSLWPESFLGKLISWPLKPQWILQYCSWLKDENI
jgi:hypothetical protein